MTVTGVPIGTRIGPYEIVGWLGAGGMGEVYRARDARLGRDVAIKVITASLAGDPARLRRFEQEARAAGQLNHPALLAVYDTGVHDGAPYIVSELLEGESLRSRLQKSALPSRKAIEYARQAAEGLAAAHDKGIVHRDVKPDNLFITSEGRIKLLDFGIAKLTAALDDETRLGGAPTDTAAGTVVGTARYMSPEQVRGEAVDARSDIFSLGVVLYEMVTARAAFERETAAETMTAILNDDPPELVSPKEAPALARILARCLEKSREARFQSARDLAFGLDVLSGTHADATAAARPARRRWPAVVAAAVVLVALAIGVASWPTPTEPSSIESLLAKAKFSPFTDFDGTEFDATISPDGRFVAFMADQSGPFHVWLKQVGTGSFIDRTPEAGSLTNPGPNRSVGFVPDGSELWISGASNRRMTILPLMGGAPRTFLTEHAVNVTWSPDGTRLVYFTWDGDPYVVADADGSNGREIIPAKTGDHNHFPVFSPDGQWIYYVHSSQSIVEFDVWRIPTAGGTPERLTNLRTDVRYLAPIDARTLLFVAPDQDRSGPWLWALDVERKTTHRVSIGLERYLSIAASANGRRLVATVAKSTAGLWELPILDHPAQERDIHPYSLPTPRALSPRFAGDAIFYLSSSGGGDGLWRAQNGRAVEILKGSDTPLNEAPSISPRGDKIVVVTRREGKQRLTLISADGADPRALGDTIDVRGGSAWSPDGRSIVTGGSDASGSGLFIVPLDGGRPVRLVTGTALDPVWSPDGTIIVYAGKQDAYAPLLAVRPNGDAVRLPAIRIATGGRGRWRFLSAGNRLVYMQGSTGAQQFWVLDIPTGRTTEIARLPNPAATTTFDIAPDGQRIIFDRVREHSDIVLIDLPK